MSGGLNREEYFAISHELEDYLSSACGPDVLTLTGGATGIFCGYVDFIAWDLPAVLNKVQDFFADTDLPWADFHTFRREAGTVSLKRPEEDELEETLTGMDYIPYTLENADAFYRQLEQWNDEDEYTRCIQALNAIPEDWRDYRFAYAVQGAGKLRPSSGTAKRAPPAARGTRPSCGPSRCWRPSGRRAGTRRSGICAWPMPINTWRGRRRRPSLTPSGGWSWTRRTKTPRR